VIGGKEDQTVGAIARLSAVLGDDIQRSIDGRALALTGLPHERDHQPEVTRASQQAARRLHRPGLSPRWPTGRFDVSQCAAPLMELDHGHPGRFGRGASESGPIMLNLSFVGRDPERT